MIAACSRAPKQHRRLAILPFENLTGDASLDWIQVAAPRIVSDEISSPAAPRLGDAYLERATHLVHTYFTKRGGELHFAVAVEDADRHKITVRYENSGPALACVDAIAKDLDPERVRAFSSKNAEAIEAWGRGEYELAVTLDPGFGEARLAWMDQLARSGNTEKAIAIGEQGLSVTGRDTDRARVELALARLRKDPVGQRDSLVKLATLTSDPAMLLEAASASMLARDFGRAVELYHKVLASDPENVQASLQLGYALALKGDLDAARAQFEKYGRLPEQELNSIDSIGEAYFLNGKFAEAEKYFMQAHDRGPASAFAGDELKKAAYARWLGGDLKGADAIFDRYLDFRAKLHDARIAQERAAWQFATGRRDQAIATLKKVQGAESAQQIAIWSGPLDLPIKEDQLKQAYDLTQPTSDGLFRTFYAAKLAAEGNNDGARKLIDRWPLPEVVGPAPLQSLVFPKYLELRRSLGLK